MNSKFSFICYSAIILSFIAGSLWRESSIYGNSQTQIISNLISLIAFVCILVNISTSLIVLPITYAFIFVYQLKLYNQSSNKELSSEYMIMRFWLTLAVIIFHLLAFNLWLV
jgi:heme/copper-type cytochrome/quinol oxidase subunit 2